MVFCARYVWLLFAGFSILPTQALCPNGWFGSKCQYMCHCEGNCDSEGDCGVNRACAGGWFGPKCQYKDLANEKNVTIVSDPPFHMHSNWLTDNDDFSCNSNPDFHSVNISWIMSYPFTWMRIVTLDPSIILTMTVSFKRASDVFSKEEVCLNKKILYVDGKTIDIYCDLNTTVHQVILRNVKSLCSLYVSGGRNVALKQPTSQSSDYYENGHLYGLAKHAVDGNTNASLYSYSCSHTNLQDHTPNWNIFLDVPIVAKMIVLYNRNEINDNNSPFSDRLKHFILFLRDIRNNTVLTYRDPFPQEQLIYRVLESVNTPVKSIEIRVNLTGSWAQVPILTLCEVEIFAECPPGTWGLNCNETCPSSCGGICQVDTGSCNTVCFGHSDPPLCTEGCDDHKWGLNCASECNSNCLYQICDNLSGECSEGCLGYNNPPYCTQECNATYFGKDCLYKCNSSCLHQHCHPGNGTCLQCPIGKGGQDCHDCPTGTYGENCLSVCTRCQLGTKCDPVTGNCILED